MSIIKDLKKNIASKKTANFTFGQEMIAENLLHNQRMIAVYNELDPTKMEAVEVLEHGYEARTVEERKAEKVQRIDDILNGLDGKNAAGVMSAIESAKANAMKAMEEKTGDGFEQYTIDACDAVSSRFNELQADKENTK